MSTQVYTKPGRAPRRVTTPAQRVAATFEGYKPEAEATEAADSAAPQDANSALGQTPETDDTDSGAPAKARRA